jgi:hypothetical protein
MALVLMSIWGRSVPQDANFLVVIVLALSGSLSAFLLGGTVVARGVIPIPFVKEHPLEFAATGGIAALVVLLLLGRQLFM